jgi:betaine-aldehyde dehydrogenase
MRQVLKMFINGEWVDSESGQTREVLNPAHGGPIAIVTEGNEKDVQRAIAAAKTAFYEGGWWETKAVERARLLYAVADQLEARAEQFAMTDTLNNGKPLREARFDVSDAVACFRYYAGIATKPHGQTYEVADPIQAMVVREPIGVCGQIVPWNYPLLMAVWKLAPALAAGNTIVFNLRKSRRCLRSICSRSSSRWDFLPESSIWCWVPARQSGKNWQPTMTSIRSLLPVEPKPVEASCRPQPAI